MGELKAHIWCDVGKLFQKFPIKIFTLILLDLGKGVQFYLTPHIFVLQLDFDFERMT